MYKRQVLVDLTITEIIDKGNYANVTDMKLHTSAANTIYVKEEVNFILKEALDEIAEKVRNETGIDLAPVEV